MHDLSELQKQLESEAAEKADQDQTRAAEHERDQRLRDSFFRAGQSFCFAILQARETALTSEEQQRANEAQGNKRRVFFENGEQRLQELGAALCQLGWHRYIPTVIERIETSAVSIEKAALCFDKLVLAACNRTPNRTPLQRCLRKRKSSGPDNRRTLAPGYIKHSACCIKMADSGPRRGQHEPPRWHPQRGRSKAYSRRARRCSTPL